MRITRRRLMHVAVAGSIALTGCGGDGGGTENEAPTGTPTETATGTPTETATGTPSETATHTPTATPTETATASGKSVAQQKYPDYNWGLLEDATTEFTTEVTLRDQSFNPVVAKVPTGTIRFVNEDSYEHSVTIPGLEIDKSLGGGEAVEVTVKSTGQYDYVCTLHPPSMLGRLVVVEETPTPGETPTSTPTPTGTSTGDGGGYY
ncbi:MAG: cupredoxin domain-containing protein [Halanaeroarchaeum sp.]